MSILTGNEAFAAMAAGQSIECRHKDATVFDAIGNFPATVFFDTDHEFRIAIVFMTIGEIQVPEAVKEMPAKGIQCFTPSVLTEELSKGFKWKNSANDLVLLNRGLVHLVQEHAETHAKALIAVSGGSLESPAETVVAKPEINAAEPEPVNEIEQVLGPVVNKPDNELTVANLQKLQQEAELLCSKRNNQVQPN